MAKKEGINQIYQPRNWNDIIKIVDNKGNAQLYTGQWNKNLKVQGGLDLHSHLIVPQGLEELKRIGRTEEHIEVGALVSLEEFINTGKKILPIVLFDQIRKDFPLPLRNSLKVGHLLKGLQVSNPLILLLCLLDCSLERKTFKTGKKKTHLKTQWLYLQQHLQDKYSNGELLCTLRVPIYRWDHYLIRNIQYSGGLLTIIALADLTRGYVSDFRLGFIYEELKPLRNKEWEASIMGRKNLFNQKEKENIYQYLLDNGVPGDEEYLKPSLLMILDNLLYHFQDREY
ncbi:MAG: FAD binding domain-containing protein [Spirochaetaceae bacterium]|jgi:xanthine dehydrogenase iron-sulfur cluster and FAD-binding subunit A|nr:FAD binding domain-containing protein [Spirochaetaceae bacterium]